MEIDHRTVSQKPIEAHFCTRHTIIIEKQQKGIPIKQGLDGDSLFSKKRPPQMRRSFEDSIIQRPAFHSQRGVLEHLSSS